MPRADIAAQFFGYFVIDVAEDPPIVRDILFRSRAAARIFIAEWGASPTLRVRRAKIILYRS